VSATDPEIESLKPALKAMWTTGDFGRIAKHSEPGAEEFIARLALQPGVRVLDVACGTGNLSIPAARAGALVTGVDIATNLLEQARSRAESEGLTIQFEEGDAENLPYRDAAFDVVVTMFGAMFAPRPERVAAELVRVCRPGGRIAMANWTPQGFVGEMFKASAKHAPPPTAVPPPVLWGDEQTVRHRFRDGIADLRLTRRINQLKYPFPPGDVVEFYRTYYGPTQRAFERLDTDGQAALRSDLAQLWSQHNRATDNTTEVHAEYLEVVATRAGG
jgi:SAM-dependent methyltransferase